MATLGNSPHKDEEDEDQREADALCRIGSLALDLNCLGYVATYPPVRSARS